MLVSRKKRGQIARDLGLRKKHLFDSFYRVINRDLTSYGGFSNPLGERIIAGDWNSDPNIDCGKGIHLVYGHPLLVFDFVVERKNPRYFKVPRGQMANPVPSNVDCGKFRVQYYTIYHEDELELDAPEFNPRILLKIIRGATSWSVRRKALEILGSDDQELLAKVILGNTSWAVRQDGILKLTNLEVLARLVDEDKDPETRSLAQTRLKQLQAQ